MRWQRVWLQAVTSRRGVSRRVYLLTITALIAQFGCMLGLTASGWDNASLVGAHAVDMEREGAPPGLIPDYLSLNAMAWPLLNVRGKVTGTAASAGGPSSWVADDSSMLANGLNLLHQSLGETWHQLQQTYMDYALFVVPGDSLVQQPLHVSVAGHDYELSMWDEDARGRFAIMYAVVPNSEIGAFDSSVTWLWKPLNAGLNVSIMLYRSNPELVNSAAYRIVPGRVGRGMADCTLDRMPTGNSIGTPVVAEPPGVSAVAGFVEAGNAQPPRCLAAALVASEVRAVILARFVRRHQILPYLGIGVQSTSIARAAGTYFGRPWGAIVTDVEPGGPSVGVLRVGDVITRINGHTVLSASDVTAAVRSEKVGNRVALRFWTPSHRKGSASIRLTSHEVP